MKRAIGILGGTFDPIHQGHLQPALEAMHTLQLASLHLMPNHIPPHRPQPVASSNQRLAMARLAAQEFPNVTVDDRELRRLTPSYTIDTLIELRQELPDTPICFLVGMDSLLGLPNWHRWQELAEYAHLVVAVRPGWQPELCRQLAEFVASHQVDSPLAVHQQLAGHLIWLQNQPLALSATALRSRLARGDSLDGLVPQKVADYIRQQGIYRPAVL